MGEREEGGEEGGRNKRERKGERVEGEWTERGESRRKQKSCSQLCKTYVRNFTRISIIKKFNIIGRGV